MNQKEVATKSESQWNRTEALRLCVLIENICPEFGCHVALTGGLLYKRGMRKDCDLVFYRIRQHAKIDKNGLWKALAKIGVAHIKGRGWIHKALFHGKGIDCFFPEEDRTVSPSEPELTSSDPR